MFKSEILRGLFGREGDNVRNWRMAKGTVYAEQNFCPGFFYSIQFWLLNEEV